MHIKKVITLQDSDNLTRYFSDIRKYKSLTKEEERALIWDIKNNKDSRSVAKSVDLLLKANLRFVISVAKRYQGQGLPILDLISEGNEGLLQAVQRFDLSKDLKFFSYAVWWIRIKMFTSVLKDKVIRLPDNRALLVNRMKKEIQLLEQKLGRTPSFDELLEHCSDLKENEVAEAIMFTTKARSLQEKIGQDEDDDTLEQVIQGDGALGIDEDQKASSLSADLNTFLQQLTQQEYDVLVLSIGLNGEDIRRTEDLEDALEIERKEIVKLKAKAMKRLKQSKNISILKDYLS